MFITCSRASGPLPPEWDKDWLSFANPYRLKDGVTLREEGKDVGRVIFSLYDMQLGVEYFTDSGLFVKRLEDSQVLVRRKLRPLLPQMMVHQSRPIVFAPEQPDKADKLPATGSIVVGRPDGMPGMRAGEEDGSTPPPDTIGTNPTATSYFKRRFLGTDAAPDSPAGPSSPINIGEGGGLGSLDGSRGNANRLLEAAGVAGLSPPVLLGSSPLLDEFDFVYGRGQRSDPTTPVSMLVGDMGSSNESGGTASNMDQAAKVAAAPPGGDNTTILNHHNSAARRPSSGVTNGLPPSSFAVAGSSSTTRSGVCAVGGGVLSSSQPDDTDAPNSSVTWQEMLFDIRTPCLPGERLEKIVEEVVVHRTVNPSTGAPGVTGLLFMTNYELIFTPWDASRNMPVILASHHHHGNHITAATTVASASDSDGLQRQARLAPAGGQSIRATTSATNGAPAVSMLSQSLQQQQILHQHQRQQANMVHPHYSAALEALSLAAPPLAAPDMEKDHGSKAHEGSSALHKQLIFQQQQSHQQQLQQQQQQQQLSAASISRSRSIGTLANTAGADALAGCVGSFVASGKDGIRCNSRESEEGDGLSAAATKDGKSGGRYASDEEVGSDEQSGNGTNSANADVTDCGELHNHAAQMPRSKSAHGLSRATRIGNTSPQRIQGGRQTNGNGSNNGYRSQHPAAKRVLSFGEPSDGRKEEGAGVVARPSVSKRATRSRQASVALRPHAQRHLDGQGVPLEEEQLSGSGAEDAVVRGEGGEGVVAIGADDEEADDVDADDVDDDEQEDESDDGAALAAASMAAAISMGLSGSVRIPVVRRASHGSGGGRASSEPPSEGHTPPQSPKSFRGGLAQPLVMGFGQTNFTAASKPPSTTTVTNGAATASMRAPSAGSGGTAISRNSSRGSPEQLAPLSPTVSAPVPVECDILTLPYACIARFDKIDKANRGYSMFSSEVAYSIDIIPKDFRRVVRLQLDPNQKQRNEICQILSRYSQPRARADVFAVSSKQQQLAYLSDDDVFRVSTSRIARPGWRPGRLRDIYDRLGVMAVPAPSMVASGQLLCPPIPLCWRFSDVNAQYTLCDSYPSEIVVPAGMADEELVAVSGFRSKQRVPVLAWRDVSTGVCIARCSQPRTGISRSFRCKEDEKMVALIQQMNPHCPKLHILDARPLANAFANMAFGGGYENISNYPECELEFLGIANIHAVRDSYVKLRELLERVCGSNSMPFAPFVPAPLPASYSTNNLASSSVTGGSAAQYPAFNFSVASNGASAGNSSTTATATATSSHANVGNSSSSSNGPGSSTPGSTSSNEAAWLSQLEATHWLDHLSTVLQAATRVAHLVHHKRRSVLLHCSDGWDRTPQVSSVAQLLLDPYYRTVCGFIDLVEKEWVKYGHKFADRLGYNMDELNSNRDQERSPIFQQFLDAVWQVMRQFPQAFEFTPQMLLMMVEHTTSARFGTFLFNSEKERQQLRDTVPSLWTYLLHHANDFVNPFFDAPSASSAAPHVLFPSTEVRHLSLWRAHYLRHYEPHLAVDQEFAHTPTGRMWRAELLRCYEQIEEISHENADVNDRLQDAMRQLQYMQQQHQQLQMQIQHVMQQQAQPPPQRQGVQSSPVKQPGVSMLSAIINGSNNHSATADGSYAGAVRGSAPSQTAVGIDQGSDAKGARSVSSRSVLDSEWVHLDQPSVAAPQFMTAPFAIQRNGARS